ncbi:MAG TPA: DEAD/DEAH box helicase [Stellaceae bacterium]
MDDALPLSYDRVVGAMPASSLERGDLYQREGRVVDVRVDREGGGITGLVRGSRRTPYRVDVEIDPVSGDYLDGSCTCPMGVDCKHVAAVMLQVLRERGQGQGTLSGLAYVDLKARRTPSPPAPDPLAGPLAVWFGTLAKRAAQPAANRSTEAARVLFILDVATRNDRPRLAVKPLVVRPKKGGGWTAGQSYVMGTLTAPSPPQAFGPEDIVIGRLWSAGRTYYSYGGSNDLPDNPAMIRLFMQQVLATGRCHWRSKDNPPLRLGPAREGQLSWELTSTGFQVAIPVGRRASEKVLPCAQPWYVDTASWECGPLDVGLPEHLIGPLLEAPPIAPHQAAAFARSLRAKLPDLPIPLPHTEIVEEVVEKQPVPCLRLVTRRHASTYGYWGSRKSSSLQLTDIAFLTFDYDGKEIAPDKPPEEKRRVEGNKVIIERRNLAAERAAIQTLNRCGLEKGYDPKVFGRKKTGLALEFLDGAGDNRWLDFVHRTVPALTAQGWRIAIEPDFQHGVILAADGDWMARVDGGAEGGDEEQGWWFSLDLGIEAEGERVALLPLLVDAIKRLRDPTMPGALDSLAVNGVVYGRLPDGRAVALPFERIKAILGVLVELFDAGALRDGRFLDISVAHADGLAAIAEATRLRWLGGERLRSLADRLRAVAASGVAEAAVPDGLNATLRPYQREGLNWLQFLGANGLGGILADDMGLGKTLQALAHILAEKRAGRLDRPCLVVCPTSLVPNWEAEAARFAPDLRVLKLHGPQRLAAFAAVGEADLALTTYPLLVRDADALAAVDWHAVVLDEAQAIKNPAAKATQMACRLKARHRLCLTGTPVENHLGEAWSQFAFLMPGLLGDTKLFNRVFRTPIEKRGDAERRMLLARRVKPFILRRTKSEVEADLPPKSEIVRRIDLAGDQRDLYETLRLAMHDRVRREIAAKGLARSHILILDALLKLRQASCDPRLVKLDKAKRVKSSAKLEHLMEMLPGLVEEGRRVLLFSQFTSMLALIKEELAKDGIEYVELTGDTVDRATPVQRFQAGEVPLFLISLKAGGVGLNLTAADTVIHYDPWWNPAVEDQATDRAHRIGQDKPVFVYKLIAAGTVEERMLDLQERKRGIADALFDPEQAGKAGFEEGDLDLLFRPLS